MGKKFRAISGKMIEITRPGFGTEKMNVQACCDLISQLLASERGHEAVLVSEQLAAKYRDVAEICLLQLRAYIHVEDLVAAVPLAKKSLNIDPKSSQIKLQSARLLMLMGNSREAVKQTSSILVSDPRNLSVLSLQSELYMSTGSKSQCIEVCQVIAKYSARLLLRQDLPVGLSVKICKQYCAQAMLKLLKYNALDLKGLTQLQGFLKDTLLPANLRSDIAFGLAEKSKKSDDKQTEAELLSTAKELLSSVLSSPVDAGSVKKQFARVHAKLERIFDNNRATSLAKISPDLSVEPIYILALPRSGTTLIEQILGGHADIGQVGEAQSFTNALFRAYFSSGTGFQLEDFPARVDSFTAEELTAIQRYVKKFYSRLTDKSVFVDKHLSNYLFPGLILHLFPNATFIHVDRHPLDIILSCFRGPILSQPYTMKVETLAIAYVYINKIIAHWKTLYPDRVYTIQYEDLVGSPEGYSKSLFGFLGLSWDNSVLDISKRSNIVRTLSVDQVRDKINVRSVGGWKERQDILAPAMEVLNEYGIAY